MFTKDRLPKIRERLEEIAGKENIFSDQLNLALHSYDSGLGRSRPEVVVNVRDAAWISPLIKCLNSVRMPFIARGGATNLSGGCVPLKGGAVLNLSPLSRILQIDTRAKYALVEPGVTNRQLQDELAKAGFFYPPDPASQTACTIGGNVAENAGGPRTFKYGTTSANLIAADVVLPDGTETRWSVEDGGPDLPGLLCGSEGTLGVATRLKLKICREQKYIRTAIAAFPKIENAIAAVNRILATGIILRAAEGMDKMTIAALEAHSKSSYPLDCDTVILLEVDGDDSGAEYGMAKCDQICRQNQATYWKVADTLEERNYFWSAKHNAYAALARLAPNVFLEDIVVPRPALPEAVRQTRAVIAKYDLRAGILFHACDGTIHPNIIFDERNRFETGKVKKASHEIIKECLKLGGSVCGEHGVGVEKRAAIAWMYDEKTTDVFRKIKTAFDPHFMANPEKIIPVSDMHHQAPVRTPFLPEQDAALKLIRAVRERKDAGQPTVIRGLGTKLDKWHYEKNPETLLSTAELDGILDLDKENQTVTAEAGISIESLLAEIEKHNLYLPINKAPGSLGGALAQRRFPRLRDAVTGMKILLSDGEVIEYGGKTLKNSAGYDISKIMQGSEGAYGIILHVTLRLSARQEREAVRQERTSAQYRPAPEHIKLKQVFDKDNLFNPWIFDGLLAAGQ